MARKKFNGIKYMFNNEHSDDVYRYVIVDGEIDEIYIKCSKDKENKLTHPESIKEAMIAYFDGCPISKEQYDNYDPRLGLIACGLMQQGTLNTVYNPDYYAKELSKGHKIAGT